MAPKLESVNGQDATDGAQGNDSAVAVNPEGGAAGAEDQHPGTSSEEQVQVETQVNEIGDQLEQTNAKIQRVQQQIEKFEGDRKALEDEKEALAARKKELLGEGEQELPRRTQTEVTFPDLVKAGLASQPAVLMFVLETIGSYGGQAFSILNAVLAFYEEQYTSAGLLTWSVVAPGFFAGLICYTALQLNDKTAPTAAKEGIFCVLNLNRAVHSWRLLTTKTIEQAMALEIYITNCEKTMTLTTGVLPAAAANAARFLRLSPEEMRTPTFANVILAMLLLNSLILPGLNAGSASHSMVGAPNNFQKYRLCQQSCAPPLRKHHALLIQVLDLTHVTAQLVAFALVYALAGLPVMLAFLAIKFMCIYPLVQQPYLSFPLKHRDRYAMGISLTIFSLTYLPWEERWCHMLSYWTMEQFNLGMVVGGLLIIQNWDQQKLYDPDFFNALLGVGVGTAALYLALQMYYSYVLRPNEIESCRVKRDEFMTMLTQIDLKKRGH